MPVVIDFSKKISNYCNKLMNRDLEVIDRVLEDLKQYLVNHIQVTDKKYAGCFNENGLK
jgi:hemerythrin